MGNTRVKRVLIAIEAPTQRNKYFQNNVPLGPLQIVSFLESRGIHTDFVDLNVTTQFPDASLYHAVGFGVNNSNITPTIKRAAMLHRSFPELKIFAGGPETLCDPRFLIMHKQFDAVILGDAEVTTYNYLQSSHPSRVPGLMLKKGNGTIYRTKGSPSKLPLNKLPFPALHKVNILDYSTPFSQKSPFSSIVTSRGCPWTCSFCFHSQGWVWRPRSASHVVSEIEWQVNKLGVREIGIQDDMFTLDQRRVARICRGIKEKGIDVKLQLPIGVRVDCVSRWLLGEMKRAGFWFVTVNPESGNPATLERIGKGFSLDRVKKVVKWCKELDFMTSACFIIGFPWEGEEEVQNTLRFARELDTDLPLFLRLTLFPGTPLYKEFAEGNKEYKDLGLLYGEREFATHSPALGPNRLSVLMRKAYQKTYLSPLKLARLARLLPTRSLLRIARYAFTIDIM